MSAFRREERDHGFASDIRSHAAPVRVVSVLVLRLPSINKVGRGRRVAASIREVLGTKAAVGGPGANPRSGVRLM